MAFAQKPGWATSPDNVVYKGRSVRILYQGTAWIDEASFRVVRLRTDLLAPHPDIAWKDSRPRSTSAGHACRRPSHPFGSPKKPLSQLE